MSRAPYGHDQRVYGTPWLTRALIALLVAVFAGQLLWDHSAEAELETQIERVLELAAQRPDARIDASVLDRMPPAARLHFSNLVRSPTAEPGPHDAELEAATAGLVEAADALSVRILGYRPGEPSVLSAITSAFAHGSLIHLVANLLFLWAAGPVIECFWDRGLYLFGYVLFGAAALAAHQLAQPDSVVPLVGASGAISGLLGAFVVGFPRTRVQLPFVEVPALAVVLVWGSFQVVMMGLGLDQGVAHEAHLGGLAAGISMAIVVRRAGRQIGDAGAGPG